MFCCGIAVCDWKDRARATRRGATKIHRKDAEDAEIDKDLRGLGDLEGLVVFAAASNKIRRILFTKPAMRDAAR